MEHTDIRKLAELMREMELTALEITEKDFSVRLERAGYPVAPAAVSAAPAGAPPTETSQGGTGRESIPSYRPRSAFFFASPSPDGKPYVSVGEKVRAGQVLCVVEAMKIMNEITSEVDGVVTELCVSDRQIVEYGHPLFRIRLSELAAQPETT
jgi:acetyl-CoA carboxylase biotin carboxyl carrier protein